MSETKILKACPFCGPTQLSYGYEPQTKANYVTCDGCFCRGPACEPEQDDEAAWNTRPTEDAVVERIAAYLQECAEATPPSNARQALRLAAANVRAKFEERKS